VEHPWTDALSILPLAAPKHHSCPLPAPTPKQWTYLGALEKDTVYAMQLDFFAITLHR
jgi:hypothetical protein